MILGLVVMLDQGELTSSPAGLGLPRFRIDRCLHFVLSKPLDFVIHVNYYY